MPFIVRELLAFGLVTFVGVGFWSVFLVVGVLGSSGRGIGEGDGLLKVSIVGC
jgi:hypothetical protein